MLKMTEAEAKLYLIMFVQKSIALISPSLFQTPLHRSYPAPLGDTQGKNMLFGTLRRIIL